MFEPIKYKNVCTKISIFLSIFSSALAGSCVFLFCVCMWFSKNRNCLSLFLLDHGFLCRWWRKRSWRKMLRSWERCCGQSWANCPKTLWPQSGGKASSTLSSSERPKVKAAAKNDICRWPLGQTLELNIFHFRLLLSVDLKMKCFFFPP